MGTIVWQHYPHVADHPAARAFIEANAKRQKRPKTLDAYARNLDDLLRVFGQAGIEILSAQAEHIERYLDDLCHRPLIPGRERVRSLYGSGKVVAVLWDARYFGGAANKQVSHPTRIVACGVVPVRSQRTRGGTSSSV